VTVWTFQNPVALADSSKFYREIAMAAAAGHDNGYPDAVKSQHSYFVGEHNTDDYLLDLHDLGQTLGNLVHPLAAGIKMGSGQGTGNTKGTKPVEHEIFSIVNTLSELDRMEEDWDIQAKKAVAYLIAKTSKDPPRIFEAGLEKLGGFGADLGADYQLFEEDEHMKLLMPLFITAEYAHLGEQKQNTQGGYICGALAIFFEYHMYGGVCGNLDGACDDDKLSAGKSIKSDFEIFVAAQDEYWKKAHSTSGAFVGKKNCEGVAFQFMKKGTGGRDDALTKQWLGKGTPVLTSILEQLAESDKFCDIVAKIKEASGDAIDCVATHKGIEAVCGTSEEEMTTVGGSMEDAE